MGPEGATKLKGLAGRRRLGEGGVILILTLFVLLITYAMVTQLTLSTSVAWMTSKNASNRIRMELACKSAAEQILGVLADDAAGGGLGGASAEAQSLLGELGYADGDADAGGGGAAEGEDAAEEEPDSDSLQDSWAKPMRVVMGDIQITSWVQDECGKFNLLTLVSPGIEERDAARERCQRIIDFLREEFDDDLDFTQAGRITEEIVQWLEGSNRNLDWPAPLRHSGSEESERILMLDLEELLLLEGVTPNLYHDQVRDEDRIAPGLETVFTVWTSVDIDSPDASDDPGTSPAEEASLFGDSVDSGGGLGEESSLETSVAVDDRLSGAQGGLDDVLEAGAGVGIRLNLNTMPRAVMEGLLSTSELPAGLVKDILHFRNEVDEEAIAEEGQDEVDVEAQALERALYGETFEKPMQFFASVDDLEEVPGWDSRLDDEQQERVKELVGTQSDVFSVHLWARIPPQDWVQESRYEEPTGPVLRMRAIVWRRAGSEGTRFILIRPWHVVSRTRWTIPDFQWDLPVYEPPRW